MTPHAYRALHECTSALCHWFYCWFCRRFAFFFSALLPSALCCALAGILLFAVSSFCSVDAFAQPTPPPSPRISYILPDVGAPGMNVYVELHAPANAGYFRDNGVLREEGAFGRDGFYANNTLDSVKVVLVNPADAKKVVLSPIVVSWEGRLISMQIFVLPESRGVKPNDHDWRKISSEWKIPLQVQVRRRDGKDDRSNIDTFYIVKPTPLGDVSKLTNAGTVFGQGGLGIRSRRGAMIVDSLLLEANKTYTVSTLDCDPVNRGNQGYLPFVLLAKGNIIGGQGTVIDVSAQGVHAGIGGGGGGGSVCDGFSISNDSKNGGDGFTGGSAGGVNGIGLLSTDWRTGGTGTGGVRTIDSDRNGETSLNGLGGAVSFRPGAQGPVAPESSGGGTGHPFGFSGQGWYPATLDGFLGAAAGGGNGGIQSNTSDGRPVRGGAGSGGGYAGRGVLVSPDIGSLIHGNKITVPIAGGSGGGGGNPVIGCGGAGGGGGGAIRLYGLEVKNLTVKANGADGGNGAGLPPHNGGAGSGGFVGIHTKLNLGNINVSVLGGRQNRDARTGYGRVRFDTPNVPDTVGFTNADAGSMVDPDNFLYVGFVTDTTSLAEGPLTQSVTLRGFFRGDANKEDSTLVMRRSLSSDWFVAAKFVPVPSEGPKGIPTWQAVDNGINMRDVQDSILFYTALRRWKNPVRQGYEYMPDWFFSQSAANILTILPLPLVSVSSTTLALPPLVRCGAAAPTASALTLGIRNSRGGLLHVTGATFVNQRGFSIANPAVISPRQPFVVRPPALGSDGKLLPFREELLTVNFTPPSGATQNMTFEDELLIFHNDTISDYDQLPIKRPNPIRIRVSASFQVFNLDGQAADSLTNSTTVDFGNVSVGSVRSRSIIIRNTGNIPAQYDIRPTPSSVFAIRSAGLPTMLAPGASVALPIEFRPTSPTTTSENVDLTFIGSGACSTGNLSLGRFTLTGNGVIPAIDVDRSRAETPTTIVLPTRCYPEPKDSTLPIRLFNRGGDTLRVTGVVVNPDAGTPAGVFTATVATLVIVPRGVGEIPICFSAPLTTQATVSYGAEVLVSNNDTTNRGANNPWRVKFSVSLKTNVFAVGYTPDSLNSPARGVNFGGLNLGLLDSRTVTITNTGNTVVVLNRPEFLTTTGAAVSDTVFILKHPTVFPRTLRPADTVNFVIQASPYDPAITPPGIDVTRTLRLTFEREQSMMDNACSLPPRLLPLTIRALNPPQMRVTLWLDSIPPARALDPKAEATVKVYGMIEPTAFIISGKDELRATVRITNSLFLPESISSPLAGVMPRILERRFVGADRVVTFSVPNVELSRTPAVIAELRGTAYLGSTTASQLQWDANASMWSQGGMSPFGTLARTGALRDGLFTMTVCAEGDVLRLVAAAPTRLVVLAPNPVFDQATVRLFMPQQGKYSLVLTTLLGSTVRLGSWSKTTPTPETLELTLDLKEYASGVYAMTFTTPEERSATLLHIRR